MGQLKTDVDLAVITSPIHRVPDGITDGVKRQVGGAIVISAGRGETRRICCHRRRRPTGQAYRGGFPLKMHLTLCLSTFLYRHAIMIFSKPPAIVHAEVERYHGAFGKQATEKRTL